jgi:translation initiation factor 2B subunit (eIF-2B alpha/beta/delta family)
LPNGVPRLAQSLRRVWFETDLGPAGAGKVLAEGLAALAGDHESGARQMAGAALLTLRRVIAEMDGPTSSENGLVEGWWEKVRLAAWHLWKNGRESMGAAIMSALLAALAGMERVMQQSPGPDSLRDAALRKLDARIAARQEAAKRISQAFAAYLEATFPSKRAAHEPISILTLSESSTIRQGLRNAALESGFVLDLRVLESRPLYEGVSLARSLAEDLGSNDSPSSAEAEHKITLYSDASAALAASDIDVVLLGADRISASGAVSNKTGSLPAVLSAKHVCPGAKVVVLGESDKIATPGRPEDHVVEDNDPSQISRAWQAEYNSGRVRGAAAAIRDSSSRDGRVKIEIRNVFFEWVPARLIDAYVTESGGWTVQQIAQHSEKLQAEQERFFGTL